MTVTDLSLEERADGLRAWAKGLYALEAAVRLMIEHGTWLRRGAPAMQMSDTEYDGLLVSVDWKALSDMGGPASGSERRILDIICSLGAGLGVDLSDAVSSLDRTNLALVLAALSHANGSHQHKDMSWFHDAIANGGTMVRPDPNEPYLPPVFAWPASS